MNILDMAHIKDIKDNKFMSSRVKQFRQFQHTSVSEVAKKLGVPPKTIYMLEDNELINNKLLLKEAHAVGMGKEHIMSIIAKMPNTRENAQHVPAKRSHVNQKAVDNGGNKLYKIIKNAITQIPNLSAHRVSLAAGKSEQYLENPFNMPPSGFVLCARALGKTDSWIIDNLKQNGVHIGGNRFIDRIRTKQILKGWSNSQLARKAHVSPSVVSKMYSYKDHKLSPTSQSKIQAAFSAPAEPVKHASTMTKHAELQNSTNPQKTSQTSGTSSYTSFKQMLQHHGYRSAAAFARKVGIKPKYIWQWSEGYSGHDVKLLAKVATALNEPKKVVLATIDNSRSNTQGMAKSSEGALNQSLRQLLIKTSRQMLSQKNMSIKFRNQLNKRINAMNQAIDYKRLGNWINNTIAKTLKHDVDNGSLHEDVSDMVDKTLHDKTAGLKHFISKMVHDSVSHQQPSNVSSDDLILLHSIHMLLAEHPQAADILRHVLDATPEQLKALSAIVSTWKTNK